MAQQKRSLISRRQIIEAAMEEFGLYDYEKASINRFCAAHQISKGRLYHQFENKEAVFCACIEYCYQFLEAYLSQFQPDASRSLAENLHGYFESRLNFFVDYPYSVKVFNRVINTPYDKLWPEIRKLRVSFNEKNKDTLEQILKLYPMYREEDHAQIIEIYMAITLYLHMTYGFPDWDPTKDMSYKRDITLERFDQMMELLIYGLKTR